MPYSEARLVALSQRLWAHQQAAVEERDPVTGEWRSRRSQAERAALEKLRRRPSYALAARTAAVARLRRELQRLESRRPCEKKTWSPRMTLARELGVTSVRLARWLAAGHVPESYMPTFDEWSQLSQQLEERRIREQDQSLQLIEQARKPGYAHTLPGAGRKLARRAPDIRTGEGLFESQENSGYEWRRRVEAWASFELLDDLSLWAKTRVRPAKYTSQRAPYWIVTALVTVLHGRNRKSLKSPGGFRQFGRGSDRALGARLEIGGVVSSGTVPRGGLDRAVKLFAAQMLVEYCEFEVMWIHGIIVRNWRRRTDAQQDAYRGRAWSRLEVHRVEREQRQERRKKAARKKAQERRRSRASRTTRRSTERKRP